MVSIHGAMTDERKKRIWFLWKQGHPMAFIAKDIMKPPATVYSFLEYHGGIEPDIRCRKATDLTLQEREYISRSLAIGNSLRAISGPIRPFREKFHEMVEFISTGLI